MKRHSFATLWACRLAWLPAAVLLVAGPLTVCGAERVVLGEHFTQPG